MRPGTIAATAATRARTADLRLATNGPNLAKPASRVLEGPQ
jgi:hypothetical protein